MEISLGDKLGFIVELPRAATNLSGEGVMTSCLRLESGALERRFGWASKVTTQAEGELFVLQ